MKSLACSTPEGIDAAITITTSDAPDSSRECSTPEGIDAAITNHIGNRLVQPVVLNARRHRCGDHPSPCLAGGQDGPCSTPEGIDAAITNRRRNRERVLTAVLNARRHRCGDHAIKLHEVLLAAGCSTPEGIDAAITRILIPTVSGTAGSAQRPKASMRRSPVENS